jgi:hypothetical protein
MDHPDDEDSGGGVREPLLPLDSPPTLGAEKEPDDV